MQLQSGNYFTIYDFAGYVPGTGTVTAPGVGTSTSNWTITSSNSGVTPSGLTPTDNSSVPNLTFTYNGPTIPSGQLTLGNFSADSTFGTTSTGSFTATNPRGHRRNHRLQPHGDVGAGGELPLRRRSARRNRPRWRLAGLGLPLIGLARALRP